MLAGWKAIATLTSIPLAARESLRDHAKTQWRRPDAAGPAGAMPDMDAIQSLLRSHRRGGWRAGLKPRSRAVRRNAPVMDCLQSARLLRRHAIYTNPNP